MQQDRFSVFSVIHIFVVRGISISQFSMRASRRVKLVFVGENIEKSWGLLVASTSTVVLLLMLVLPWIQSEGWYPSYIMAWWREEVISLPLKVKPGNTWYKCCDESECVKRCEIRRRKLHFSSHHRGLHFSGSFKQNPCSCLQILQGWKKGLFLLGRFFHPHIFSGGGTRVGQAWNLTWAYFLLRITAVM